jgi:hypothetical protein
MSSTRVSWWELGPVTLCHHTGVNRDFWRLVWQGRSRWFWGRTARVDRRVFEELECRLRDEEA